MPSNLSHLSYLATIFSFFRKYFGLTQTSYFLKSNFFKTSSRLKKLYAQKSVSPKRISYKFNYLKASFLNFFRTDDLSSQG
jgi:hypothetical protein